MPSVRVPWNNGRACAKTLSRSVREVDRGAGGPAFTSSSDGTIPQRGPPKEAERLRRMENVNSHIFKGVIRKPADSHLSFFCFYAFCPAPAGSPAFRPLRFSGKSVLCLIPRPFRSLTVLRGGHTIQRDPAIVRYSGSLSRLKRGLSCLHASHLG